MEFAVLGPLQVRDDERLVDLAPSQSRLLALLLCRPNQPVAAGALAAELWGDEDNGGRRLQLLVHRVRNALGARDRVVHERGGYSLRVLPGELDSERFGTLARAGAEALRSGQPHPAVRDLGDACRYWRGPPFDGLDDLPTVAIEVTRLDDLRLSALEQLHIAELETGHASAAVAGLAELVERHPLKERLGALLMIALHRCDRRAEALDVYQRSRRALIDELGLEPGAELQRVHAAILGDLVPQIVLFGEDRAAPAIGERAATVPRQLPPDTAGFVGRTAELDELTDVVRRRDSAAATPTVVAIVGAAGIGKTTFAVHWAHRVADEYPDGQVRIDLRGHSDHEPVSAAAVLGTILRAFDVRASELPEGEDERSALLRSHLAGKRVLLLLDNVRSPEQVRPLLPAADCLVVVTSRNQLSGLSVHDSAHRVTLDVLEPADALRLLTRAVGTRRATREPSSLAELAHLCGGIPLALRIAGERATRIPDQPLSDLVDELAGERDRLEHFGDLDDAAADLRAVFSWSYHALDAESARAFRLLGLHPSNTFSLPAAAVLVGESVARTQSMVDRLVSIHLLQRPQTDRYAFHDLIRLYAAELAHREESESTRADATRRMLDLYLQTVAVARDHIRPRTGLDVVIDPAESSVAPLPLTDSAEAITWLETERQVLIDCVGASADGGFDDHAWKIAWCLHSFFDHQQHHDDWVSTATIGLAAAKRLGGGRAAALAGNCLGSALLASSRIAEGLAAYEDALAEARRVGDVIRELVLVSNIGYAHARAGRHQEAIENYEHAAVVGAGSQPTTNLDLNLAASHGALGNYREAIRYSEHAIETYRRHGERLYAAIAQVNLAEAHLCLGEVDRADELCEEALAELRSLGQTTKGVSNAMVVRGRIHHARGDREAAREAWSQARAYVASSESERLDQIDELFDRPDEFRSRTVH
ncbi:AfsR/SARP family transcriptional regulator [Tenggerimyces flavus]|uniref:BTAD domain-containing putative transcriptional regulator n=1 Tax=Tenggerimyces flavus TaxID=1708749 RepID=A0ABV7YNC6_9ACTN|nr:BTAD domain-containing putative transcriptional regulator [Tenggerimyces flavus]MBM7789692.1 DNA-binding SARP family transcriptional activator/tetratricopeptide (TPR) repeat protein [Tenggerimyces flavus]